MLSQRLEEDCPAPFYKGREGRPNQEALPAQGSDLRTNGCRALEPVRPRRVCQATGPAGRASLCEQVTGLWTLDRTSVGKFTLGEPDGEPSSRRWASPSGARVYSLPHYAGPGPEATDSHLIVIWHEGKDAAIYLLPATNARG